MRVSVVVMVFVGMCALARQADACSCVHVDGCGAIRATDVIFEATVESITPEPPPVPGRRHDRYIVRLTEIKALRGKPESRIFMSAPGSSSCDYIFKAGTRYVIHATTVAEGYLSVSTCSLTRPAAVADDVRACVKRD